MTSTDVAPRRGGRRRPKAIILLMVVAVLQGLGLLLLGVVFFVARGEPAMVEAVGDQAWIATAVGSILVGLGLARIGMAILLGRGVEWVRLVFGGLAVVQVALASYALVTVRDTGVGTGLALAVVELWLLYGSEQTQEFFHR